MHADAILCLRSSASGLSFYKSISRSWEEATSIFNTASEVKGMEVIFKISSELQIAEEAVALLRCPHLTSAPAGFSDRHEWPRTCPWTEVTAPEACSLRFHHWGTLQWAPAHELAMCFSLKML